MGRCPQNLHRARAVHNGIPHITLCRPRNSEPSLTFHSVTWRVDWSCVWHRSGVIFHYSLVCYPCTHLGEFGMLVDHPLPLKLSLAPNIHGPTVGSDGYLCGRYQNRWDDCWGGIDVSLDRIIYCGGCSRSRKYRFYEVGDWRGGKHWYVLHCTR